MHPLNSDASQSDPEHRAEEIRRLIVDHDVGHGLERLLDLCRDFGSRQSLNSALMLSYRYRDVSARIRDFGPSANDTADRNQIVGAVFELIDRVVEQHAVRARRADTPRSFEQTPAKEAFIAGSEKELTQRATGLVLRAHGLGHVRRVTEPAFALSDVSIDLELGEILAVVGANGHGKSTLLEVLSGRLERSSGELEYPFEKQDWSLIKRHIAYMSQSFGAGADMSETALRYTAGLYGSLGRDNDLVIDYIFARLGLAKYRTVPAEELSRGYQVRFGLARALLKRPRLLILDEPLAHLDLPTQMRVLGDLRHLSRSPTNPFAVVISSQHIHEIESVSDKTLALDAGQPGFYGSTEAVGALRDTETYELQCDRTYDELRGILSALGDCYIERSGVHALVRLPRGVTSAAILGRLVECETHVSYFRNVGMSARLLLRDES